MPLGDREQFVSITCQFEVAYSAIELTAPGSGSVNSFGVISHVARISHRRIGGGWYGTKVLAFERTVTLWTGDIHYNSFAAVEA
jgi:hypothetical protein